MSEQSRISEERLTSNEDLPADVDAIRLLAEDTDRAIGFDRAQVATLFEHITRQFLANQHLREGMANLATKVVDLEAELAALRRPVVQSDVVDTVFNRMRPYDTFFLWSDTNLRELIQEWCAPILSSLDAAQREIQQLKAQRKPRKCAATLPSDPPQDCDAPFCGCEPQWQTCMGMLLESGWLDDRDARELQQRVSAVESFTHGHGPECIEPDEVGSSGQCVCGKDLQVIAAMWAELPGRIRKLQSEIARLTSPPEERRDMGERNEGRKRQRLYYQPYPQHIQDIDLLLTDVARLRNAHADRVRMLGFVQDELTKRNRECIEQAARITAQAAGIERLEVLLDRFDKWMFERPQFHHGELQKIWQGYRGLAAADGQQT